MVTRQAQIRREKRRSIRLKTDSMQTRMKMDRKRKRAAGTVTKNVRWSSVVWRGRERGGGESRQQEELYKSEFMNAFPLL